jgi:hypothetical protein
MSRQSSLFSELFNLGLATAIMVWLLICCVLPAPSPAAIGCDLNYPDRDVARLFPGSARYTTKYFSLTQDELTTVLAGLGKQFQAIYEPLNVRYTLYEIYDKNDKKIGYIHGVNQKGQFGGIQVFIVQDLAGTMSLLYIQKITGMSAAKLRDNSFCKQFQGVSLKDFNSFDPVTGKGTGNIAAIRNPAPDMETDFYSVLRALKKNLILMDVFVYSTMRKHQ